MVDGSAYFVPGAVQLQQALLAPGRQAVVLARGPGGRLLPAVGEQAVVLQARQQGIERAFHHNQVCVLHAGDDFRSVGIAAPQKQQHAEFEHAFAHLGFEIVDIHSR